MDEITRILDAVERGDSQAAEQLLPLAYDELRRIAAQKMARERAGHTLQPTALVHEAYIRLLNPDGSHQHFKSRAHFFVAAAEAMRRILVENARRKMSLKRGGNAVKETWDEANFVTEAPSDEIVAVHEAMDALNEREQHILTERRLTENPQTLEELSQVYSVSRERIRQIEVRAFEKLQKAMQRIAGERLMPTAA